MMSGICFKRFQKGRKEGEKEDGKEEKKKRTLGRDNGTRLAKCEQFLAA